MNFYLKTFIDVISVTIPIFIVVAIGYLFRRKGVISDRAVPSLNKIAYYLGLTTLIFTSIVKYDLKEITKEAETKTWNRCVRTFRGSNSQIPGVCFAKDAIYRPGNISVWQVAENNPEEIKRFKAGKYDPSNQRHTYTLDQLDIK